MVELKTEAEIEAMAAAGAVVAEALRAVVGHAAPGRSTAELDQVAAQVLARHGAASPFLNYHPSWAPRPFPAVLCVSVNDAVVHGIPNGQRAGRRRPGLGGLRRHAAGLVRRRGAQLRRRHTRDHRTSR